MLSVIFTLKHFKTIINGYEIYVYTDNLNNTYPNSINQRRCQRWQILIQEYGVTLVYVKGNDNNAADYLSRLPEYKSYSICTILKTTISSEDISGCIKEINILISGHATNIMTSNEKLHKKIHLNNEG